MPALEKERLVRAFAAAIRGLDEYVPGPDMGTDETCMAWVHDEIGRAVGLPRVIGGIPLDDIGATGFGLAACADALERAGRLRVAGARVAVQGFGAVGRHAARFLAARGAVVVAVADTSGGRVDPTGLDLDALVEWKAAGKGVGDFPGGAPCGASALVAVDCDVWIPAARPDVLTVDNVGSLTARVVLEGANIPATPEAETLLDRRGVLVVPDFVANAGGVICAATEYRGGSESEAFAAIEEKIRRNTLEVLDRCTTADVTPRAAAEAMARERVAGAAALRRRF
jgi:glutamate dehydrogenase/leucine dehydrogenase